MASAQAVVDHALRAVESQEYIQRLDATRALFVPLAPFSANARAALSDLYHRRARAQERYNDAVGFVRDNMKGVQ